MMFYPKKFRLKCYFLYREYETETIFFEYTHYVFKSVFKFYHSVTAKLISAFVFATRIVQFLFFLNPKFQVSCHLLQLYSLVCVRPGRKPRRPVFSERGLINSDRMGNNEVMDPEGHYPQNANAHLHYFELHLDHTTLSVRISSMPLIRADSSLAILKTGTCLVNFINF